MKISRTFIVFIVVFIALVVGSQYLQPKHFVWNATYRHLDRQPLGSFVFDSIMSQTMPRGYSVCRKTFYQLAHDGSRQRHSILVVAYNTQMKQVDLDNLMTLARRGDRVMIAAERCGESLERTGRTADDDTTSTDAPRSVLYDSLGVDYNYYYYPVKEMLLNSISQIDHTDTLLWYGRPDLFPQRMYVYEDAFNNGYMECDRRWTRIVDELTVADDGEVDSLPKVISRRVGRGEIILCTTPMLLSNYGILHRGTSDYVLRLMTLLADRPTVRTEAYMTTEMEWQAQQSPLRVFLERPPLAWAVRLSLLLIVLFFVFTARRRQRVIPVIAPPRNYNLQFVRAIGSLSYHKHRNRHLVMARWRVFADDVRRRCGLDVQDTSRTGETVERLSRLTWMDAGRLEDELRQLRYIVNSEETVSDEDMKEYINQMNEIWKKTE